MKVMKLNELLKDLESNNLKLSESDLWHARYKVLEVENQNLEDKIEKIESRIYEPFKTGVITGIILVFALVGLVSSLVFLFK